MNDQERPSNNKEIIEALTTLRRLLIPSVPNDVIREKRVIDQNALCKKLGLSRKTLWRSLRERDCDFPQTVKGFKHDKQYWYEHEIEEWLERERGL